MVWDEKGKSNFGDLQAALKGRPNDVSFVAFDLLHFDGKIRPIDAQMSSLGFEGLVEIGDDVINVFDAN